MIITAGEALIDLIVGEDGQVTASLGGGPFNVARAVARLGQPVAFLGRLSADRFGTLLRDDLDRNGVRLVVPEPAEVPTTLAIVEVGQAGVPGYRFYLAGTSAAELRHASLPSGTTALHVGGLGLVAEPAAGTLQRLTAGLPSGVLLMLDPNCRPAAITRRRPYLDRIARVLSRTDVVKASAEDLDYLYPGAAREDAAAALLDAGPACVIITDGAAPVRAFTAAGETGADVPAAEVVDTVGAGDALGGAFLAWWAGNSMTRDELADPGALGGALAAAVEAAAVNCTRRGAEPPWARELSGRAGWDRVSRTGRGASPR